LLIAVIRLGTRRLRPGSAAVPRRPASAFELRFHVSRELILKLLHERGRTRTKHRNLLTVDRFQAAVAEGD
jgi:hypothetical protein